MEGEQICYHGLEKWIDFVISYRVWLFFTTVLNFSASQRAAACPGTFRALLGTPVGGAGVLFTVTQVGLGDVQFSYR